MILLSLLFQASCVTIFNRQRNKESFSSNRKRQPHLLFPTMAEQQSAKKKVRNKATEALPECLQGITGKNDTDIITEDFLIQHNEYEEDFGFMKGRVYPKAISILIPRAEGAPAAYPETFPLETLNQRQLAKLSSAFGLRNASKMKKEVILITLGGL